MVKAMKYWVTEAAVDGFRCDYPGRIPVAFWDSARKVLEKIKPVFMLAEDESHPALPEHAFDMNYSWELLHLTEDIAGGKKNVTALQAYFNRQKKTYPLSAYRMNFITNHDENSWNGTAFERYGESVKTFAVLIFTLPGMPLIYSGQEAGLKKRLRFFEKDTISWADTTVWDPFYHKLITLKKKQEALWNGMTGGEVQLLQNDRDSLVFSFLRKKDKSTVVVIENLSRNKVSVNVKYPEPGKIFTEFFTGDTYSFRDINPVYLPGWGYHIFISAY